MYGCAAQKSNDHTGLVILISPEAQKFRADYTIHSCRIAQLQLKECWLRVPAKLAQGYPQGIRASVLVAFEVYLGWQQASLYSHSSDTL